MSRPTIAPCLWFDDQAEAAADLYTGIFPDSSVTAIARYPSSFDNPSRPLLGPADARRRGGSLRLAQGPLRRVVASGAHTLDGDDPGGRDRRARLRAGVPGHARDEEAGHRGADGGARRGRRERRVPACWPRTEGRIGSMLASRPLNRSSSPALHYDPRTTKGTWPGVRLRPAQPRACSMGDSRATSKRSRACGSFGTGSLQLRLLSCVPRAAIRIPERSVLPG